MTLFLAGDVMPGRGLDQALPQSVDPGLFESHVRDARVYLRLAEGANGPIDVPLEPGAVWGAALADLERVGPAARVVNLETAVTDAGRPWRAKGIHYRMHPANLRLLTAAAIDVAVLANNHVLDWGREGLADTLRALAHTGVQGVGAGEDAKQAWAPVVVPTPAGRLLVVAACFLDAGVPPDWRAGPDRSGVALVTDTSNRGADALARHVLARRRPGDRVVLSLHWGPNWGYAVAPWKRAFAHRLIDAGAADLVHGHSSHHPLGIEVYRGRAILYGCGDLINDYEGIGGRGAYRGDLSLLYLPTFASDGALAALELVPMRLRRFQLERAPVEGARWLMRTLDRESRAFGARVEAAGDRLAVRWT